MAGCGEDYVKARIATMQNCEQMEKFYLFVGEDVTKFTRKYAKYWKKDKKYYNKNGIIVLLF